MERLLSNFMPWPTASCVPGTSAAFPARVSFGTCRWWHVIAAFGMAASAACAGPAPAVKKPISVSPPGPALRESSQERAQRLRQAAALLQEQKGPGAAVALLEQATQADPQCVDCWFDLGNVQFATRQWQGALASWARVAALGAGDRIAQDSMVLAEQRAAVASAPAGAIPVETTARVGPSISFKMVGDIHLGRGWPPAAVSLPDGDASVVFDKIRPTLRTADLTFGNLETVLMDSGESAKCGRTARKCYAFRVPTLFAQGLAAAGFDALSVANNHAGDFGDEGRSSTIQAINTAGIQHSGPVGQTASFQVHGVNVAFIAFHTGWGVHRVQEIALAREHVERLARSHDIVVVSFHGGAEGPKAAHVKPGTEMFLGEDRGDLIAFAHAVIDAGADLVFGHGPHRLRAVELYRNRLIAYSLGNFSTWGVFNLAGPRGISAVLQVTLAPNGVVAQAELIPVRIGAPGQPRIDERGEAIKMINDLSIQDFGRAVFDAAGKFPAAQK